MGGFIEELSFQLSPAGWMGFKLAEKMGTSKAGKLGQAKQNGLSGRWGRGGAGGSGGKPERS